MPELADVDRVEASIAGGEVAARLDSLRLGPALAAVLGRPKNVLRATRDLAGESLKITFGRSKVAPAPKDWRFTNAAWRDNPVYRRIGQGYLAWSEAMLRLVDVAELDWRTEERARFAMTLLTSALSPTNILPGNPAALERAFETAGLSLVRGARNVVRDVRENGGMPRQVDRGAFRLGTDLAATPGAVVYRNDVCEVIQYTPTTGTVRSRPVVMVPPQINKYYFMDLAPGRSFVEYAVSRGLQFFAVSWRNPGPEHGHWGLSTYVEAARDAIGVARSIAGSDSVNLLGLCAGGITSAALLAHLADTGDDAVHSASFAVTLLDFDVPSMIGMFGTPAIVRAATEASGKAGVLDGRRLGALFSLLRPNDLVWNYWVDNNLMGKDPPVFDILAWNADSTRLPAALHADFMDIFLHNSFAKPGEAKVLGSVVDLGAVTCDNYVVAGRTDHLTPWRACYATTQMLHGRSEFVLTSSGHIQSLVNPVGNTKMQYFTGGEPGQDPDAWLAGATANPGSWWEHWASWVTGRSGDDVEAPSRLGSTAHPPVEPAPGRYVLEP
jgi:polyhydroxyalkanoate synthase